MSWLKNFNSTFYFAESKNVMVNKIKDAYEKYSNPKDWYDTGALEYVKNINNEGIKKWIACFDSFKPTQSNSDKAKINEVETTSYKEFIISLERKALAIDDVKSVLTNKGKFNIIYTDENTYLTKDKDFLFCIMDLQKRTLEPNYKSTDQQLKIFMQTQAVCKLLLGVYKILLRQEKRFIRIKEPMQT